MKRTKILFVHQVGCRGGAGTMLANIISALDKTVFEPVVVCPEGDGNEQLIAAGAEVRISPRPIYQFLHYTGYSPAILNPYFIKHAFMLWRDQTFWETYIRNSSAEIVCLGAMTLAPMARAARRAGARVLCVVQETAVRGLLGMRTAGVNHMLSVWMDAVVFISQYAKDTSNCRAPIVEVIPNWVDLTVFDRMLPRKQARTELDIRQDASVVLMMGGINKLKGTLSLVEASALLSDVDKYVLVVAGYSEPLKLGPFGAFQKIRFKVRRKLGLEYRQKVLRIIKEKKLGDRIRFIGMQANVGRLYAAADILAFPADRPHQARPVLEAGAMAKPVVMPDFPETREFVKDGFNAITYRHGDIKSLAIALRKLLVDSELAKTIGENNYYTTCEKHDGAKNAARFQQVFFKLAKTYENGTQ